MSSVSARRRVTSLDVAREAGVSRATVGFVLNDTPGQTISEVTRERVLSACKRLGYRPHSAAQALRSGRTRIILLVLPDWPLDYSMSRHLEEASLVLDRAGYALVTMTAYRPRRSRPLWETLQPDVVMGLIPLDPRVHREIVDSGATIVTPGVGLGREEADHAVFGRGPALQVAHLLDRGCRNLVFAADPDPRLADLVSSRYRVAREKAQHRGAAPLECAEVREDIAHQFVDEWVRTGVDGVVAYNDDVAAIVTGAAMRRGIEMPGRLAVVGHDDAPVARRFVPAISSVHIDNEGLGRYFAQIALAAAEGSPAPAIGHVPRETLVIRDTG